MKDYRDVEILPDSVIYCDIPYKDTREYRHDTFDHKAFYDWAMKQAAPLFISEYWMPEDRFECVAEFERVSTFSATNNSLRKVERIFRLKHQLYDTEETERKRIFNPRGKQSRERREGAV